MSQTLVSETMSNDCTAAVVDIFKEKYGGEPEVIVAAPGIIQLFNDLHEGAGPGICVPLDRYIYVAAAHSRVVRIFFSLDGTEAVCPHPLLVSVREKTHGAHVAAAFLALVEWASQGDPHAGVETVGNIIGGGRFIPEEFHPELEKLDPKFNGGFEMVVHGNIPVGVGCASSSALLVAAANALASLWNLKDSHGLTPTKLGEICAAAEESYLGLLHQDHVDRAALISRVNERKTYRTNKYRWMPRFPNGSLVWWVPRCEPITTPEIDSIQWTFEIKLGCALLLRAQHCNLLMERGNSSILTLVEVRKTLGLKLKDLIRLSEKELPKNVLSKEAVLLKFNKRIVDWLLGDLNFSRWWKFADHFNPRRIVLYLLEEWQRTRKLKKISSSSRTTDAKLLQLGAILNESDTSLGCFFCCQRSFSKCSKPASDAGSFGSRVINPWGRSCVVSLVRRNQVDDLVETLKSTAPLVKHISVLDLDTDGDLLHLWQKEAGAAQ